MIYLLTLQEKNGHKQHESQGFFVMMVFNNAKWQSFSLSQCWRMPMRAEAGGSSVVLSFRHTGSILFTEHLFDLSSSSMHSKTNYCCLFKFASSKASLWFVTTL